MLKTKPKIEIKMMRNYFSILLLILSLKAFLFVKSVSPLPSPDINDVEKLVEKEISEVHQLEKLEDAALAKSKNNKTEDAFERRYRHKIEAQVLKLANAIMSKKGIFGPVNAEDEDSSGRKLQPTGFGYVIL